MWAARLQTPRGDVVRVYEFDRYNATVYQVDLLLDGDELWTHVKVTNPNNDSVLGYCGAGDDSNPPPWIRSHGTSA